MATSPSGEQWELTSGAVRAHVVEVGGGLLVEDADVDPAWVAREIVPLLGDGARLRSMSQAAESVGHRDADETLADMVADAWARGGRRG